MVEDCDGHWQLRTQGLWWQGSLFIWFFLCRGRVGMVGQAWQRCDHTVSDFGGKRHMMMKR